MTDQLSQLNRKRGAVKRTLTNFENFLKPIQHAIQGK